MRNGGDAAKKWATHICFANYFNSDIYNTNRMVTLAYEYSTATPARRLAILDDYINACGVLTTRFGQGGYPLPQFKIALDGFVTFAKARGLKITFYEGGYSPDFFNEAFMGIAGIKRGTTTVLTLKVGNLWPRPGDDIAMAGMSVTISGVGGTVGLNGNTYTVLASTPTSVTLAVDLSAMGAYASGGVMTYVGAGPNITAMNFDLKFHSSVKVATLQMYQMIADTGISEFPSEYSFSGRHSPYTIWDPNIYASPAPPRWLAIEEWG